MFDSQVLNFNPSTDEGLSVDLDKLIAHKLAIQANSGGGKSWLMRTLLEGTHGHVQHLIIDPDGEFRTLRSHFDDYIIIGGEGTDLHMSADSAMVVMKEIIISGANIILDLSDLKEEEQDLLCAESVRGLMNLPRAAWRHLLVVADEAQRLAPQVGSNESLKELTDLAIRGRKRGFGLVVATQRLSLLNNNLLAMCSNRLVGLTTLGNDMKRAAEELGFNSKERLRLKKLAPGEWFAFGPAISQDVVKVHSAEPITPHPELGQIIPPAAPASSDLRDLIERLASDPPEENDTPMRSGPSEKEINDRVERAVLQSTSTLSDRIRDLEHSLESAHGCIREAEDSLRRARGWIKTGDPVNEAGPIFSTPPTAHHWIEEVHIPNGSAPSKDHTPQTAESENSRIPENSEITTPQQRILDALAAYESIGRQNVTKTEASIVAGYKPGSGHVNNVISQLRTAGLIDYPEGGELALTDEGRTHTSTDRFSLAEIHNRWLDKCSNPEKKLLKYIVDSYPGAVSRDQLAIATDYTPGTGHFNNLVSALSSLEAVEYPSSGMVRATPYLFPPELKHSWQTEAAY